MTGFSCRGKESGSRVARMAHSFAIQLRMNGAQSVGLDRRDFWCPSVEGYEEAFAGFDDDGAADGRASAVHDRGQEDVAVVAAHGLGVVGEVEQDLEAVTWAGT